MFRSWRVAVEGAIGDGMADGETLAALQASLSSFNSSVEQRDERVAVTVAVEAESARAAAGVAEGVVLLHARKAGLRGFRAVRLEVVDAIRSLAQFEGEVPDILGSAEVAEILGVSRQRVQQLRAEGRFPEPILELSATPIWLRRSIDAFLTSWSRRPGRPAQGTDISRAWQEGA